MKKWLFVAICGAWAFCVAARADDQHLQPGDLVAICGDSITEQKNYSVDMEDYFVMCKPVAGVRAEQFGWGGETSWGFLDKMPIFTLPFKPTVATTCYGMNDGGYGPLSDDRAKQYRDAQTAIIEKFKQSGVHFIVLGSPGVVDTDTFNRGAAMAVVYNQTLAQLRDIDREVAQKEGVTFADLHDPMMAAMAKSKAKYGKTYAFAGNDGVHPGRNGHLVMAYAMLKALGMDGNIGTITVDLAAGKAQATEGHKIVSVDGGAVTVESTRYPFCFYGDPAAYTTRSMMDFIPFNDELNRFMLVVANPGADRVKITWGDQSKEFSAADLAKGINLAAEFIDNPFSKPFADCDLAIHQKQERETALIKNLYFPVVQQGSALGDVGDAIAKIQASIEAKIDAGATKDRDIAQPVTYTIKIEPLK